MGEEKTLSRKIAGLAKTRVSWQPRDVAVIVQRCTDLLDQASRLVPIVEVYTGCVVQLHASFNKQSTWFSWPLESGSDVLRGDALRLLVAFFSST